MITIITFPYNDQEKFKQALDIRTTVFVNEQKVDQRLEFDGKDPEATHYLAYYKEFAVGTARWRKTEKGIKLERFAILPDYRNKKIGKEILLVVLKDVTKLNQTIYLNSQKLAIGFYKQNGFCIEGDPFFEAGIEHVKMIFAK